MCPKPTPWDRLWQMLPGRKRVGGGWDPPPPLILAAWWTTPGLAKLLRLEEHIRYAAEQGVLTEIDAYLRALPESDWAHLGDH